MITRNKLTILIWFLLYSGLQAQILNTYEPYNIVSPNAASLGVYGNIPVSHFTGTPNISIPIYTVSEGNLTVPISLSYHASGIKPENYPSWVGSGWSLQAGGTITRIVNGLPDEAGDFLDESGYTTGYLYTYPNLGYSDWNTNFDICKAHPLNDLRIDTEPDEFMFNFQTYHGSFFLDYEGNWQVKSDDNIKVILESSDIVSTQTTHGTTFIANNEFVIFKFTLITSDGTKYTFGGDSKSIEFSRPSFKNGVSSIPKIPIANSWNLTKIESADGKKEITFEYDRQLDDLIINVTRAITSMRAETGICSNTQLNYWTVNGQIIEPSYLKRIITSNSIIEFNCSLCEDLDIPDVLPGNYGPLSLFLKEDVALQYDDINYPFYDISTTKYNLYEPLRNFVSVKLISA